MKEFGEKILWETCAKNVEINYGRYIKDSSE